MKATSVRRLKFEGTRWLVGSRSRPEMAHLVDTDYDGLWQCGCERSMIHGEFCRHMRQVRRRMSDKKKYPRAVALQVAAEMCRKLKPHCAMAGGIDTSPPAPLPRRDKESECAGTSTGLRPPSPQRGEGPGGEGGAEAKQGGEVRLIVAGSLRRRKELVGDVEILFVPRVVPVRTGLFAEDVAECNQAEMAIACLVAEGVLIQRIGPAGSTSWGLKNKLAVHVASGVPVDLFTASEANWFNYLTCRTGGAENNVEVASAAQRKGWKWNPYGEGFTNEVGLILPVRSEREVFELVGLKYLETWERK